MKRTSVFVVLGFSQASAPAFSPTALESAGFCEGTHMPRTWRPSKNCTKKTSKLRCPRHERAARHLYGGCGAHRTGKHDRGRQAGYPS